MKLWSFCLLVVGLSGVLVAAKPQGRATAPAVKTGTLTAQVARGQSIFALRCAVCHGETGGGLEEARLAFPEDHRRCESCHKPGNPNLQAQMGSRSFESVRGRTVMGNAFAIGIAPPLHGPDALAAFGDAEALKTYIRVAMPRHAPGTLNGEQSYALTAFILKLNRALPKGAVVNRRNAVKLDFR